MTQAIRPSTLIGAAIEPPAAVLLSSPLEKRLIVEAIQFAFDPERHHQSERGRWIIRERDTATGLIRESTETFASPELACIAYWYEEPIAFEAWISPAWITTGEAA